MNAMVESDGAWENFRENISAKNILQNYEF
jgi:hypothetical protein